MTVKRMVSNQKVTSELNVYQATCPTRLALDLIANKWTALIVGLLEDGPQRFAALSRQIGGISQKMLTQTLRSMERDGLVKRTVYAEVPPRVEYALTPLGQTLRDSLGLLRIWAEENVGSIIAAQKRYDDNKPKLDAH
jgi:DNA-binding HxlR family transcriptional regulator